MKRAILAGATGLIGSQVLDLLIRDNSYQSVIAITRKALTISNPKLQNLVFDFDRMSDFSDLLKGDDVYCCMGTTIKQAGTKEAFRKVDFSYPVDLANITQQQGARQFLLVTALGANKSSSIFYNQVKGEVEEAISSIGFITLHIFQPSMLIGPRRDARSGETAGQGVMKFLDFMIPKKYKAIESSKVAKAMINFASRNDTGKFTHQSGELQSF